MAHDAEAAFRDALARGLAHWRAGRAFEAHEAWEEAWRREAPGGVRRRLLHGLIQAAAARHLYAQGRAGGARTVAARALATLSGLPSECEGLALGPVRKMMARAQGGAPMLAIEDSMQQCPYCGERVEVDVDGLGAHAEQYTEDCPVCCRPWVVSVRRDAEGEVLVALGREDD